MLLEADNQMFGPYLGVLFFGSLPLAFAGVWCVLWWRGERCRFEDVCSDCSMAGFALVIVWLVTLVVGAPIWRCLDDDGRAVLREMVFWVRMISPAAISMWLVGK